MNTKTMRLPPRRVVTSNKRKERDGFDPLKPSPQQQQPQPIPTPRKDHPPPPPPPPPLPPTPQSTTDMKSSKVSAPLEPVLSNQYLAGYLAHEYLTRGTLFGQPWDQVRAEAVPTSGLEPMKKMKQSHKAEAEPTKESYERYVEVSSLLKSDGAHLPGIVNPTQLARILQMGR